MLTRLLFIKHCWFWLLFLCCGMVSSMDTAPEVILTLDRDYFNPFALGVKYDLSFKNVEKDVAWDVTYTILDNRTQTVYDTQTFRNMTFNRQKGFYFFIDTHNKNAFTTTVCVVGDRNGERNNTVVNGGLKSHYMDLPLKIVLPTEKKSYLFSVKPANSERGAATFPEGFTRSILGGNGIREVDWSIFLELQKK